MEKLARSRYALRLLAGIALAGAALPAQAQMPAPANAVGLTKAEAILGGAPSRLAAILAAQSSGGAPAIQFAAAPVSYPASFARPAFELYDADPTLAASPERPDVFNSVAMPISASPLDRRFDAVADGKVRGSAGAFATSLRGQAEHSRIEAVNAYVNARVAFVADSRQYGVADRWSAASDTLATGRGDCEDYALAKMALLRRAGFADKDLYLVVLNDTIRRADHAVLVVRSEGRFVVLDNGTNRLLDSARISEYRPVLTFTAGQRFTHGYRRNAVAPPLIMASATTRPSFASSPYPSR